MVKRKFFINDHLLVGLIGLLIFAGICAPQSSHACSWNTCDGNNIVWNNGWTNMYISTTSFPAGSSWDSRLQNAMWHWNNVKGSDFNFYVGRDTDGSHNSSNGRNEVYFDNSLSDALAVTSTRYHCYRLFGSHHGIDETDIGFNSNMVWSTSSYNYGNPTGSPFSLEGVALHELGHALGLKHEDRWMASMNSYYPTSGPFGDYKEWDPFGDDRLGVRILYPDSTTENDIAASPLKRTGSGTSDLVSSPDSAARGSYVTIEFTFSNLSTSSKTFDIGFYLSTDSLIRPYDTLIGMNYNASGTACATGTFSRSLQIPSSISPGTYYLGFIVDESFEHSENNESNNFQAMPNVIQIY